MRRILVVVLTVIASAGLSGLASGQPDTVPLAVAAPGDTIASALTGSGSDVLVISGTSMASPHVAGIAALGRQAHPDWSVAEVKAAVVNTADADVHSGDGQQGPIAAPNRVDAGRVDAAAAVRNQVLVMVPDDPGQVSAGFGVVQATGPVTFSKTITVVNKNATAARYAGAYQPITTMPGGEYQLSSRSVDIALRAVAALTVTLRIVTRRCCAGLPIRRSRRTNSVRPASSSPMPPAGSSSAQPMR